MKKLLKKEQNIGVYYFADNAKIYGKSPQIYGDISSNLSGNISGLSGDIDECDITDA